MLKKDVTVGDVLAINPDMRRILRSMDWLGFDSLAECLDAIITHEDFATRWDFDSLQNQKIAELWRMEVLKKFYSLPNIETNYWSFTSAPLFKVIDCEINRSYYAGLINKYLTNPPAYCIVVNV